MLYVLQRNGELQRTRRETAEIIHLLYTWEKLWDVKWDCDEACAANLCNSNRERTGREQAEKPNQRLWEVSHQHGEQRHAAEHHRQHGAHGAGKLGLFKQWSQHEREENLRRRKIIIV